MCVSENVEERLHHNQQNDTHVRVAYSYIYIPICLCARFVCESVTNDWYASRFSLMLFIIWWQCAPNSLTSNRTMTTSVETDKVTGKTSSIGFTFELWLLRTISEQWQLLYVTLHMCIYRCVVYVYSKKNSRLEYENWFTKFTNREQWWTIYPDVVQAWNPKLITYIRNIENIYIHILETNIYI